MEVLSFHFILFSFLFSSTSRNNKSCCLNKIYKSLKNVSETYFWINGKFSVLRFHSLSACALLGSIYGRYSYIPIWVGVEYGDGT